MRKTKIICTMGPAVDSEEVIKKLILNGMDCARLNFSHGDQKEHKVRMDRIKKVRKELKMPTPILLDTRGPEIRLKNFENESIIVETGQKFTFSPDDGTLGNQERVCISYPELANDLQIGSEILVDDGKVGFDVIEIKGKDVICVAQNGGKISDHKGVNIPNVVVNIPFLSKEDRADIAFGVSEDIDYIAASFVRTAKDVLELREFLKSINGSDIKIISKIENMQGVQNIDAIIEASDAIMVARGDMGVEIDFTKLPHIQKSIIKKCYLKGKIVITATQMLESMTSNPRPTRAEASDVANAIYDGTTCIMLSGETAAGKYPVEAVKAMKNIALTTESSIDYADLFFKNDLNLGSDVGSAIGNSACTSAYLLNASAIIAVTKKGLTAKTVSAYRPGTSIIACCLDEKTYRQLNLNWNVLPLKGTAQASTDALFSHGVDVAKSTGLLKKDDAVVIVGGSVAGDAATDVLKIQII